MKAQCKARVGTVIGRAPTQTEEQQIDRNIKRSMRQLSKTDPEWRSLDAAQRLERAGDHAAKRQEAVSDDVLEVAEQASPEGDVLFQGEDKGPRGSVSIPGGFGVGGILGDGDVVVRLTEAADQTTFLHELAHIFLEIESALEGENAEIDTQMQAIREWLGVKPGEKITVDQHEKFADSFELYLMRGIAPTPELRSAFVQFRQWFVNVYNNIKHRLTKLDPEAIEIFDALLASEEEIEIASEEYGRILSDHMAGTMTDSQLEKYRKDAEQARVTAEDKIFRKHLKQIEHRQKAEYRRVKKAATERFTKEFSREPVYKARAAIEENKLDRGLVRELRSEGFDAETTEAGGAHPEIVAAEAGFTSADAMLTLLENQPSLDAAIKEAVQAELDQTFGNLLTDGTVQEEAIAAVFNEPSIRMMEAERNALAEKAAGDAIPLAAIRAKAEKDINELPIRDAITPGRYAIKARNLHKRAIRAAAQKKWDAALRYTHQAMLQHEKARRAYKARDEITRGERALARYRPHKKLDPKRIDPEYIAAIRILMSLPGQQDQTLARQQLEAFALKQQLGADEDGGGVHVILPTAVALGEDIKDKRDMSMDEWRDYKASIQSLNKMGRDLSEEGRAERAAEARAIADIVRKHWEGRPAKDKRRDKEWAQRVGSMVRQGDAMILRYPFLIEALQGGATDGQLVRMLELRMRQALTDRNDRRVELGREFADIMKKHGITQLELGKKIEVPELDGAPVKFERVLVAAMNMGTESNRERMINDPETADIEAIDAMLDARLDKRHWDAVQDIWNLLGSLWPESAAMERRLTGVTPQALPARGFTNKHGTYKGGYFPVAYRSDITANADIKEKQSEDRFKALKAGIATRASTPQGRLKERRTTTRRPLELSFEAILTHIDDTTTDLYLREEATRLDRIFRDKNFRSAVEDTHGSEYLKTLDTVLKRTVAGSERAQDVGERILQGLRVNASVAILGANIPTAALAPVSYVQTVIPRYGRKVVMAGISEFYSDWGAANKLILEKSAFMRERQDTYNRESHELVRKTPLQSGWGKIQGTGFLLMTEVEKYTVSGPVWLGVYRDAIANGDTERDAITLADRAVATTQGSGLEIDQSSLQSGNESMRAFSFMWGYLSGYYGTVRGDIASRDGIAKVLPAIKHLIVLNAIASALEVIVRGELWDEDDDPYYVEFANRFRRNIEGIIPGVGLITSPFDSSAPGVQSAKGVADTVRSYGDAVEDIYEQGYVDAETQHKVARETLKGVGILAGVPGTIQVDKALKTHFEDDDPTIMEYLMTGPDSDN